MYGKVFSSLWTGSLVGKSDAQLVMCYLIANCDAEGVCEHHPEVIASLTGLGLDRTTKAIELLTAPDPGSRTDIEGGCRIATLDGRGWGWRLVNYAKYRSTFAERQTAGSAGHVYYAGVQSGNRVKIGFSRNAWARIADLRVTEPAIELLALEKGSLELRTERHAAFSDLRISGEWFRRDGKLAAHIASLSTTVATDVATKAEVEVVVEVEEEKNNNPPYPPNQACACGEVPEPQAIDQDAQFRPPSKPPERLSASTWQRAFLPWFTNYGQGTPSPALKRWMAIHPRTRPQLESILEGTDRYLRSRRVLAGYKLDAEKFLARRGWEFTDGQRVGKKAQATERQKIPELTLEQIEENRRRAEEAKNLVQQMVHGGRR